jgi:hypothetical protein
VPVDERGNVKHPVNTDELILNVCNDKLGLDINLLEIIGANLEINNKMCVQ